MPTTLVTRTRRMYGAHPLQLVLILASFVLAGYAVQQVGIAALWNRDVWWQSIVVWFVGAALAHDLLLFPVYAAVDRILNIGGDLGPRLGRRRPAVPVINYLRVPLLACGLVTLIFFPGVIRQGAGSYHRATGMTQDVFLRRWLLLCIAILLCGLLAYLVARLRAGRAGNTATEPAALDQPHDTQEAPPTRAPVASWAVVAVIGLVLATRRGRRSDAGGRDGGRQCSRWD